VEGAGLNKHREIFMHVVIKVLGKAGAQYILVWKHVQLSWPFVIHMVLSVR